MNIGPENTTIYNSYNVTSISEMKHILNNIREFFPESSVNKRSNFSMINEWRTHNLLYSLNIYRDRTKDVDLNINNNILYHIGYFIGSLLYFKY